MQRLRDIAKKVYEEFKRLLLIFRRQTAVLYSLSVIGNSGDDTATRATVTGKVDRAGGWRGVFGINEASERSQLND